MSVRSHLRATNVAVSLMLVALVVAGAALWSGESRETAAPKVTTRDVQIDVLDGPEKEQRVVLDLRLYVPAETPAPAVVLAHGFGGNKNSLAAAARQLARRGFTVLTYSSRGFGNSTGKSALNLPAYEVTDAKQILDWLARQPEVVSDGEGDPLVGVAGVSYGGALSLLLAGHDQRVDAIAPIMTYNELATALLPNAASTKPIPGATPARGANTQYGVFKQAWTGLLFTTGAGGSAKPVTPTLPNPKLLQPKPPEATPLEPVRPQPTQQPSTTSTALPTAETATAALRNTRDIKTKPPATCGNFTAKICAAYTELAKTGKASPSTRALLHAASPASVTDNINVPTLLVQGLHDRLFSLAQADANARQIAAAGGTVKVLWWGGDHTRVASAPKLWSRVGDWFAYYLDEPGGQPVPNPGTAFEYRRTEQGQFGARTGSAGNGPAAASSPEQLPAPDEVRTVVASQYPGIHGEPARRISVPLRGKPTRVINPPGGSVASEPTETTEPSPTGSGEPSRTQETPGSSAIFRTAPLDEQVLITGVPQVRLSVASVPGQPSTGQAVLFATLYDVAPSGERTVLGGSAVPLRVRSLPADGTPVAVDVALSGMVATVESGHRIALSISASNPAFSTPDEPSVHLVGLAGAQALSLPSVPGTVTNANAVPVLAIAGLGVLLLIVLLSWAVVSVFRRYGGRAADPALADTPLVVSELSKSYSNKITGIRGLSLRVDAGQVVGLLGPNGAGKTTTLRLLLGLLRPSSGQVRIYGHAVSAGSPILSRVGSSIGNTGLLPTLSGLDNLRSFWAATGRPAQQARFDDALEIAGLGDAADREVSTYSHGMRQRLAIAQAMLGLPDLLVLDEPTSGLDPHQTHQVRKVLRRYAATGRAVVLTSHQLAEVEQTCTHVVIMYAGERVTGGAVEDIVAAGDKTCFRVDQPQQAAETLRSLEGIGEVHVGADSADTVVAELAGHSTAIAVNALVGAGISVHQVGEPHKLEDRFLELLGEERR